MGIIKNIGYIFTLCVVTLCVDFVNAQDPNLSMFYNNPMFYNPAMTAYASGFGLKVNARNQWHPIQGKFNTVIASFESEVVNRFGLGLIGLSDVAGDGLLKTTAGYINYSYRPIDTKKGFVQFGMSGGYVSKSIDWKRLTFSDQYDEVLGKVNPTAFLAPSYNSISYPDVGFGLCGQFQGKSRIVGLMKKWMLTGGAGFHHLNRPKDAFFQDKNHLPIKTVFHVKAYALLGDYASTFATIFENQNRFRTLTFGANIHNQNLNLGAWVRNKNVLGIGSFDSFIFSLGSYLPLSNKKSIRITYSVDFTISRLRTSSFWSHEIALVYGIDNFYLLRGFQEKRNRDRKTQCPSEFKVFD